MSQQPAKIVHIVALLPFFATGGLPAPFLALSKGMADGGSFLASSRVAEQAEKESQERQKNAERKERAAKIDAYFSERSMPLAGYGAEMVAAAEDHDLDWRLLPAIAVRESSGGKHSCDHNPFGWASCKRHFESISEAIAIVAQHLGGNHPKTEDYYGGDTREKLYYYNGTVISTYPDEVMAIMDRIGKQEVSASLVK